MLICNFRYSLCWLVVALAAAMAPSTSQAVITGTTLIADGSDGLENPIYVTHAPGRPDQLFVVQRGGAIRIVDLTNNTVLPTPVATVSNLNIGGEGGALGLAFHPDFATNGRFYVNATLNSGATSGMSTHILEYTMSTSTPNVANPTARSIINIPQPQNNHNGGWIDFGPDGYLYVAMGDGGNGDDVGTGHTAVTGNALDLTDNLLGKMLRLDVNGDAFPTDAARNYAIPTDNPFVGITGDDEIWAYGLRNPWRNSFDRLTGDLWIGDVGQNVLEEIDFQPASSNGGENYGWRYYEGNRVTGLMAAGMAPANHTPPVYDYDHTAGTGDSNLEGNAVNGGYVYRGADADLRGLYFFSDSTQQRVWRFDPANPNSTVARINSLLNGGNSLGTVVSMGEDADGNIYIVDISSNRIFRIDTDIMLTGDFNGNGTVDAADLDVWRTQFGSVGRFDADANQDNIVDIADYTIWRDSLGRTRAGLGSGTGVPEPASWLAMITGSFVLIAGRRIAARQATK